MGHQKNLHQIGIGNSPESLQYKYGEMDGEHQEASPLLEDLRMLSNEEENIYSRFSCTNLNLLGGQTNDAQSSSSCPSGQSS